MPYSSHRVSSCLYCPTGRYNPYTTRNSCYSCSSGYYCPYTRMTSLYSCPAGRYSSGSYRTSCSYCTAGYYCSGVRNTSPTRYACPAGRYSGTGASSCSYCPAGRYTPAARSTCYTCPAGRYSGTGSSSCTYCPTGQYNPYSSRSSCYSCPAGRYGSSRGLTSSSCNGVCAAGYYCPAGSSSNRQYKCGGSAYYCPSGSSGRRAVSAGYYGYAGADGTSNTFTTQRRCDTYGYYCSSGIKRACPAGRYGAAYGLSSSTCTGPCQAGYYCVAGATTPRQNPCGTIDKYCPAGSSSPRTVSNNYYTTPTTAAANLRTGQASCPSGRICAGGVILEAIQWDGTCPQGKCTREVNEGSAGAVGAVMKAIPGQGQTGTISYALRSQSVRTAGCRVSGTFSINSASGQIMTSTGFNYEDCREFVLVIRATLQSNVYIDATVTVNVVDVNEAPRITDCAIREVEEQAVEGTKIGAPLRGTDPDSGQSLTWFILNNNSPFTIGACDGQVIVKNPKFYYSVKSSYSLTIKMQDDGSPTMSDTCTLAIRIKDRDDPPTFVAQTFEVSENAAAGTIVGNLEATDEETAAGSLVYALTQKDVPDIFTVNSNGRITLTSSALDYEAKSTFNLKASVRDAKPNTVYADLTIKILDAPDSPVIGAVAPQSVAEGTAVGTYFGTAFTSTDQDAADSGGPTWSVSDNDYVTIGGSNGRLRVANTIDYETVQSFQITVIATDTYGYTDTAIVDVTVTDVNEKPTITTSSPTFAISEAVSVGTSIGSPLTASDPDLDQAAFWSITAGTGSDMFAIDAVTGQLKVAKTLDYETKNSYSITVKVTDNGKPALSDSKTVTINVENANEPPVVTAGQVWTITENVAPGTVVGTVAGTDVDSTVLGCQAMFASGSNGKFSIDESCQITVADAAVINYEDTKTYSLEVRMHDDGSPQLTASGVVTVKVRDVNEAPVLTNTNIAFVIPANLGGNRVVGTPLTATDEDVGQTLTWTKVGGNDVENDFTINPTTGQISTSSGGFPQGITYLRYVATDNGVPPLSTEIMNVTIQATNTNNGPSGAPVTVSLPEDTEVSTLLTAFKCTDPDNQLIVYSLPSGNDGDVFTMNSTSGEVRLIRALDFETTPVFNMLARCTDTPTDGPGLSFSAPYKVIVTNVNEKPSIADAAREVDENSPVGTYVGEALTATDPDSGDTLTYAIQGGNIAGAFRIETVSNRGQIRVNKDVINYEVLNDYNLVVSVTDSAGLKDTANVVITVNDKNDPPTVPAIPEASVPEDAVIGTTVTSVSATDEDAEAVIISITGGNTGDAFVLTPQNKIQTAKALDYETTSSYSLIITATDGSGATASRTLVINVGDVNEKPTYTGPIAASVAENSPATTVIMQATASDQDNGDVMTYSLTGDNAYLFRIDAASGAIRARAPLNYESTELYPLTVVVTDRRGLSDSREVTITVTDVNEKPTITTSKFELSELAETGDVVGTFVVSDEDVGQSHTITILGGNGDENDRFSLDGLVLKLDQAAIDFEGVTGRNKFSLTVSVADNATSPLSSTRTVEVIVLDKNEPPVINDQTRDVDENSPINTDIGNPLVASDPDAEQTLSYSITGGNTEGIFKIDGCSGQLKVDRAVLDFESTNEYTIEVTVTDDGPDTPGPARLTDKATITININDVNERPVVSDGAGSVNENSAAGTYVLDASEAQLVVGVTDPESYDTHTFAIAGGNVNGAFAIEPTTGKIKVANVAAVDFETTPTFTLNVTATDSGTPSLTGWGTITVNLVDVNEAPVLDDVATTLPENSIAGTAVGSRLAAVDQDVGQTLTYSLTGGADQNMFTVSSDGFVRVASGAVLDYESENNVLEIVVTVTDDAASPLSDTATITISLTNVNEPPTLPDTTVSIAENSAIATAVDGTLNLVQDVDAGDSHRYEIVSQTPADGFRILPSSGRLEVKTSPDHERFRQHVVEVRVTDSGDLKAEGTITVNILDVNEPPVIDDQDRSVDENANSAEVGAPIVVSDVDGGLFGEMTCSIVGGDLAARFTIEETPVNGTWCQLFTSATANLNHEVVDKTTLTVKVSNTDGLSDTATITVNIANVNEAPTFSQASYSFIMAENARRDTSAGIVSATDVDEGDTLTWSMETIQGGVTDFDINPQTGLIQTQKYSPDSPADYFNVSDVYKFRVTVRDDGVGRLSATTSLVEVTIIEYNDPPVLENVGFRVPENSPVGTTIGSLVATDVDADQVDLLEYSIIGGAFSDVIRLTTVDNAAGTQKIGLLTVASDTFNFEARQRYVFTAQVKDPKGSVDTATIEVNVTDVGEKPTLVQSSLTMDLDENPSALGGVVGTVRATDPDAADAPTGVLSFSFTGTGNSAGHFAIDSATGVITVASYDINRETQSTYKIGIKVTDSYGLTDESTLTIAVNDLNDAPVLVPKTASVNENGGTGDVVTSVAATDEDSKDRHTYTMGRDVCWAHTATQSGVWAFAPLAAEAEGNVQMNVGLRIKAASNARVALRESKAADKEYKAPTGDYYEIIFGADSNTKTVLRRCSAGVSCGQPQVVAEPVTGPVLSSRMDKDLWVAVIDGTVYAGEGLSWAERTSVLLNVTDSNEAGALAPNRVGIAASGSAVVEASAVCYNAANKGATNYFNVKSDGDIEVSTMSSNYEKQRYYGFEVVVTDSGTPALSDRAVVGVSIKDVNERMVWQTSTCVDGDATEYIACLTVPENTVPGTSAATLGAIKDKAQDPDTLAGQLLTFVMSADGNVANSKRVFAIDATLGTITVAADVLNYEIANGGQQAWVLTVTGEDNGAPALSASGKIHVAVTDVNEAPVINDATVKIDENSVSGATASPALVASDVDAQNGPGPRGSLTFSITGGDGKDYFAVEPSTGSVSVSSMGVGKLNFEDLSMDDYSLTVRATDGEGLFDEATVTVSVQNINEAPTVNDAVREVNEMSLAPTRVGVALPFSDVDNTHPIFGEIQQVFLSIVGGDGRDLFKVDPCGGQIEVAPIADLDYETKNNYTLIIEARDDGTPRLTDTATVTINIIDVNDRPEVVVPEGGYMLEVQEGSPVGTVCEANGVDRVTATDEDRNPLMPEWSQLSWSITAGNALGIFAIDSVTGQISIAEAGRIDFEDADVNKFVLTARVCDGGEPALCDTTDVTITVTNKNEPPVLDDATRSINENTKRAEKLSAGMTVGEVLVASDPDGADDETRLVFSIVTGDESGYFYLETEGKTASIRITDAGARSLDYEVKSTYMLKLMVKDVGGLNDTAMVTVKVLDLNEYPELPAMTFNIDENSPVETKVAGTSGLVVDQDIGDTHTYLIVSQEPASIFRISPTTGELEVRFAGINFEATAQHLVRVRVTDRGGYAAEAQWLVDINDVQESPTLPDFTFSSLAENSVAGTAVGIIAGADQDAADAGKLTYSIVTQEQTQAGQVPFSMDGATGTISVNTLGGGASPTLNYELKSTYKMTVRVTDTASNTADSTVTINLVDVNEPPRLSETLYFFAAATREATIAELEQFVSDEDAGDTFSFELLSGNVDDIFAVDLLTGKLYIDNEGSDDWQYGTGNGTFWLNFRITDSGGLFTENNLVAVEKTNFNDYPTFDAVGAISVDENAAPGTLVATIIGQDPQFASQKLTYTLSPRGSNINRPFPFRIETVESTDPENRGVNKAEIYVAEADGGINYEGLFNKYEVAVTATDDHEDAPLSATVNFDIKVNDLNEAPYFEIAPGKTTIDMTIPENSGFDTVVGGEQVVGKDVDIWDQSLGQLVYSWAEAPNPLFKINSVTGEVAFKADPSDLNFEDDNKNSYSYDVVLTDSKGASATATINIAVTDVNEAPTLSAATYTFSKEENSLGGTVIGSTPATDPDASTSARGLLSFALVGDASETGPFLIDSDGQLTLAADTLDWENKASYTFSVRVTDSDPNSPLTDTAPVTVNVIDVNDLTVTGFEVSAATVAAGKAWNVDVAPDSDTPNTYNGQVVDWRTNFAAMDVLFMTEGGARVIISGTNMGMTQERVDDETAKNSAFDINEAVAVSATYGPNGKEYSATNCVVVSPGSAVECEVAAAIGIAHVWTVTVNAQASPLEQKAESTSLTGYAPPLLTEVSIRDPELDALSTKGGDEIYVRGLNLGPQFSPDGAVNPNGSPKLTPISVRYGPSGTDYSVDCQVLDEHTTAVCVATEGIGANLKFSLTVGGQTSALFASAVSYETPFVAGVGQAELVTEGGEEVTLYGRGFGPLGTTGITAVYHYSLRTDAANFTAAEGLPEITGTETVYTAVNCRVSRNRPHEQLICESSPGIGFGHSWEVTVGGQTSAPSDCDECYSTYKPPVITKISGQGSELADTKGGQPVIIDGSSFGPVTPIDENGRVVGRVQPMAFYGRDVEGNLKYQAVNCRVTTPHRQVICETTEGTGKDLIWDLVIGGQPSGRFEETLTSYQPPVISFYTGAGSSDADTRGGESVLIEGRNFGPVGTVIENSTYGRVPGEFIAANCSLKTPHTLIECLTVVGAGEELTWSITIDGQASVAPTTDYAPPVITGFRGVAAADASTEGNETVTIIGQYFSVNKHLDGVTYGPTGSEYIGQGCRVTKNHNEITCRTVPGTGRALKWLVTVGGQRSGLSEVFTSYAPPSIRSFYPMSAPTQGGATMRIKGDNFALLYPLATRTVYLNALGKLPPRSELVTKHWKAIRDGQPQNQESEVARWIKSLAKCKITGSGLLDGNNGSYIDVQVPEGFGPGRELIVEVDGVLSDIKYFSYDAPFISNVAPDRQNVEKGLLRVFLEGTSFCNGENECGVVKVDGVPQVPELWGHNQLMFIIPDPKNRNQEQTATVEVGGVVSNPVSFRKPVPNFNALEGQGEWYEMDTEGGEYFYVAHVADIDTITDHSQIEVLIGPYKCTNLNVTMDLQDIEDNTRTLECRTPAGVGKDLSVIVEVPGGRSRASELVFSYAPPKVYDFTTGRNIPNDPDEGLSYRTDAEGRAGMSTQGQRVAIIGKGFGRGPTTDITATMDNAVPLMVLERTDTRVIVRVDEGDGKDHVIDLIVGDQSSVQTAPLYGAPQPTVRYAPPTIVEISPGPPDAPTAGGQTFRILGSNFGAVIAPKVMFGGEEGEQCEIIRNLIKDHGTIHCATPAFQGKDLPVTVEVSGQLSNTDVLYTYNRPQVTAISPADGPTSGRGLPSKDIDGNDVPGERYVVTLTGQDLGTVGRVYLVKPSSRFELTDITEVVETKDNNQAADIMVTGSPFPIRDVAPFITVPEDLFISHTDDEIQFYMPEGYGEDLRVLVEIGGQFSRETDVAFSYDPPKVVSFRHIEDDGGDCEPRIDFRAVRGEVVEFYRPAGCFPTLGGFQIEIIGESFGRSAAVARVGPYSCDKSPANPQTHNRIVCEVNAGMGDYLPVKVTVGGRTSVVNEDAIFAYDPPRVDAIVPNTPDALGDEIEIQGANFGDPVVAGAEIRSQFRIEINGKECLDARWFSNFDLRCNTQADTVGPKNVTMYIANRTEPFLLWERLEQFVTECNAPTYYGLRGEECLACETEAPGANCTHGDEQIYDLVTSLPGWWRFNYTTPNPQCHKKRQGREECPYFAPCEPKWACLGNNLCAEGYTADRCSQCIKGEYYRINGECEKCPDQPWLVIVFFFAGAICAAAVGWALNSRQVNVAFISIGIDYFQVLALFSRARVRWPELLRDIFRILSAFNLNLELAAPECAIPDVTYTMKWMFTMALPLAVCCVLAVGYYVRLFLKASSQGVRDKKKLREHYYQHVSIFVVMMYFLYLILTRTTLDVFNCTPTDPPDGNEYMSGMTDVVCFESEVHLTLLPFAALTLLVYVTAVPIFWFWLLRSNKDKVKHDQILRALAGLREKAFMVKVRDAYVNRYTLRMWITDDIFLFRVQWHRLYYLFKPGKWYWVIMILLRKFLIAFTSLMFRATPNYQLAMALLVVFAAYALQVRHTPYMSPGDHEEVLSQHAMMAELPAASGKENVHATIKAKLAAVETANNPEGSRVTGGWRDAARQKHYNDMAEDSREANYVAMLLIDYNTVESVLLACAVLVCLSGIMFLSARFSGDLASYYQSEYDSLAVAVATLVILSCVYFLVVLSYEIWYLVNRESAERFVACFSKARGGKATAKAAAKSGKGGSDSSTAMAAAGGSTGGAASLELVQSPLMAKMAEEGASSGTVSDDVLESISQPSAMQWAVLKLEFKRMRRQVEEMQRAALDTRVDAERSGAGSAVSGSLASGAGTSAASAALAARGRTRGKFGPMMSLSRGPAAGGSRRLKSSSSRRRLMRDDASTGSGARSPLSTGAPKPVAVDDEEESGSAGLGNPMLAALGAPESS